MNDITEAIGLLREEVDKHLDIEQSATAFLTNIFLDTYSHDGADDEEDPTPSLIHDIPVDIIQRVVLIIAGCALAFQQESEEVAGEALEDADTPALDRARWESYLDGVITLTSGLMGLALAVSDSATAAGELTVEDIIGGASSE